MPIYEYICNTCEHKFEQLVVSSNDNNEPACPECGSTNVKKVISAPTSLSINLAGDPAPACNPNSPFS